MIRASGIGWGSPSGIEKARAITGQTFSQTKTSPFVTLKIWLEAAGVWPLHAMARASRRASVASVTRVPLPG
jgi:hypothetical protein